MHLLLLSGFSNYQNRTIRKAATPAEYAALASDYLYITDSDNLTFLNVNFMQNDGVSTTQVVNVGFSGPEPDYCVVFSGNDPTEECVISRWFIMEIKETRGKQRELLLRRDLIADYYEELKTADVYVERGLCDNSDPIILNSEGMSLNQIKKSESVLKDDSACSWIVGYMDGRYRATINIVNAAPTDYLNMAQAAAQTGLTEAQIQTIITGSSIEYYDSWGFYWLNKGTSSSVSNSPSIRFNDDLTGAIAFGNQMNSNLIRLTNESDRAAAVSAVYTAIVNAHSSSLSRFKTITGRTGAIKSALDKLINLGKPILYDGVTYNITKPVFSATQRNATTLSTDIALKNILQNEISVSGDGNFGIWPSVGQFSAKAVVDESTNATFNLGGSSAKGLKTRPYKMFCLPIGYYRIITTNPTPLDPYPHFDDYDGRYSIMAASAIISQQAGDIPDPDNPDRLGIYDIQLLPYCPIRNILNPMGLTGPTFTLEGLVSGTDYETIESNNEGEGTIGYIFYCEEDSFETIISKKLMVDTDEKYDSNCKLMRLCSPNYQGSFDFNVAKNGGVSGFVIDCTYKPYTPFIRVAPQFGWLYGAEYRDQRGLLCGGNFSLSQITSAWRNYELNNKNYQNIFNREIQSLDLHQRIQMNEATTSAVVGTMQGGVSGAQTGLMTTGSPYGAIAGAAVGASVSAVGGAIDVSNLALLQKDQKQLAIDKFNYQLGNIKALPNTLTKVDAFDISSKVWPFLEEYGPTEEEKTLFQERMRLQSYTIMRIEKLQNQMTEGAPTDISQLHYVKGQLIRTDNALLKVDAHQWDEIYAELYKGVYI